MPKVEADYPRSMRIRVSDDDVEQLRSTAEVLGVTVSEFVRQSFREAITDASAPEPREAPPIPADVEWIAEEISRLCEAGLASRAELEERAAYEWDRLLEEARVLDGFDRLPDHRQAASREHDALRAWVRALDWIEAHPQARERRQAGMRQHKQWRRAMNERRAEYAQLGLPFGAPLPDVAPRRNSKALRLHLSSESPQSEPRPRTGSRPRARRTAGRRTRAPGGGDDPSDLARPAREEPL